MIYLEFRAGEGGDEAKLLLFELTNAFLSLCRRRSLTMNPVDVKPNRAVFEVRGAGAEFLQKGAGGYRFQRTPPKKSVVHSCTVTVAVLSEPPSTEIEEDFKVEWFSGGGAGGQHRNKHQNCCRVTHIPSGLTEVRQGRKRSANLSAALSALKGRLEEDAASSAAEEKGSERRHQIGSGMKADKLLTIQFQNNRVTNHRTGRKTTAKKFMKGFMEEVW